MVDCKVGVTVLQHYLESYRPSSTGHLIRRVVAGSRHVTYRKERPLQDGALGPSGREIWVLHPLGEIMPESPSLENLQVVLVDGNWTQSSEMARSVGSWGRRVRLPMTGNSRYWLREQSGTGRFSTVEALMFLLSALGLTEAHDVLELQFELHVFASLRARGQKQNAADFLVSSRIQQAFPELLASLTAYHRA